MTCIVGVVHDGNVFIGGDSAGIAGLSISIRADEKVFSNGPFVMGFTSSFRMGQLLRYKFNPPTQTAKQDDMKYMVTDFVDALRKCFAENGFGEKDVGGTFLVGYKGNLYTVQSDFQIAMTLCKYDAVGCGSDLALGSLFSTESFARSPQERVTMALRAASTHNAGVAAPFLLVDQKSFAKQSQPKAKVKVAVSSMKNAKKKSTSKSKRPTSKRK